MRRGFRRRARARSALRELLAPFDALRRARGVLCEALIGALAEPLGKLERFIVGPLIAECDQRHGARLTVDAFGFRGFGQDLTGAFALSFARASGAPAPGRSA